MSIPGPCQQAVEEAFVPLNAPRNARHTSAQKILLVLGTALAAYFVYLIVAQTNFHELTSILKRSDILYVTMGFITLACAYVFRTLRLHFIVSQQSALSTPAKCAKAILVGVAINNIYPFRLGDLYRVVAFRTALGLDGAKMLGALVIERIVDLSCILLFLAIALAFVPNDALDPQIRRWSVVLMGAAILLFVLMLFTPRPLRWLLALLDPHVRVLRGVLRFTDSLLEGIALAVVPRVLIVILLLGLAGWTIELAVLCWMVAQATRLEASFSAALLGLVLGNLSTLFPSVPGYIGTFDYFTISGITGAGGDANQAAAFAIVVHVTIWLFTTTCGLIYFFGDWYRRFRNPSVVVNSK